MAERILGDCCLIAIVRNEAHNELGGIAEYLRRIVPHVGAALILDTGSDDDTLSVVRGALESASRAAAAAAAAAAGTGAADDTAARIAQSRFVAASTPYVAPFSFARARNESLRLAHEHLARLCDESVRLFLVLDADECVDDDAIHAIRTEIDAHNATKHTSTAGTSDCTALDGENITLPPFLCLKFNIDCFARDERRVHRSNSGMLNPRLFSISRDFRFEDCINGRFERLLYCGEAIPRSFMRKSAAVRLRHYIAAPSGARRRKNKRRALDTAAPKAP